MTEADLQEIHAMFAEQRRKLAALPPEEGKVYAIGLLARAGICTAEGELHVRYGGKGGSMGDPDPSDFPASYMRDNHI